VERLQKQERKFTITTSSSETHIDNIDGTIHMVNMDRPFSHKIEFNVRYVDIDEPIRILAYAGGIGKRPALISGFPKSLDKLEQLAFNKPSGTGSQHNIKSQSSMCTD
jgi:hypothetical protein